MIAAAIPIFSTCQSSLNPVGPAAGHIEHQFALIFWITASVYFLVLLTVVVAVSRKHHSLDDIPAPQPTNEAGDRIAVRAVASAMSVSILLLFIMLVGSFNTSRALGSMNEENAVQINVYGHQWWWEVYYPNDQSYKIVETANEIHVPVGVPIRIHGTSRDVIHSFWAPNVHGKRDLLPGYDTDIIMQVDQPGRWRGQCAEYCGEQHAHMSFFMVAESKQDFQNWLDAEAQNAAQPTNPQTAHGQQVFLTHACVLCHTVRGTSAGSRVGPDLTHLANRSTIAAGLLPNTVGNLGGWILNPQAVKPGSRMPPNKLSGSDLQDLLAYLETLH